MSDENLSHIRDMELMKLFAISSSDGITKRAKQVLTELVKLGLIRAVGRGHFTLTALGIDKAIENRHVPPADE